MRADPDLEAQLQDLLDKRAGLQQSEKQVDLKIHSAGPPRPPGPPLSTGGSGGTSGGMSEDWKASVDKQLSQLHGDVRLLIGALIVGFLILAGGGWTAYSKLADDASAARIEQAKSVGEQNTRNAEIAGKLDVLLERKSSK